MIWEVIAVAGVLGGVAGVLGWAFTRGLEKRNKNRAVAIRAGLVAGVVALGTQLVTPALEARRARAQIRSAGVALFGSEHAGDLYADMMLPIIRDPRFAERLKAANSGPKPDLAIATDDPGAASLAATGMMRLPLDELARLLDVKRALADSSPELCAGFWKGQIPPAAFAAALQRLTEAQQALWMQTSANAMTLELAASAPPEKIPGAKASQAVTELAATLPETERATLVHALQAGAAATPEDACSAYHSLADHTKSFSGATRELLIRMVTTPDAVGD